VQGQSLEEGRYVGVSKNWCHCPCAPWNVDLEAADPPVEWTNMACFYSVCKEDQCARQCHMLLLSPERPRQSLGSAGIHFRWKWWGQQPGHFQWHWSTPTSGFKVTLYFDAEISVTVRDTDFNGILMGTYIRPIVSFQMTLSDLEWLSKIFDDTKHRAASLRQQSYLLF